MEPFPFTPLVWSSERSAAQSGDLRCKPRRADRRFVGVGARHTRQKDSYDDMNFTPPSLARITASTLIVYGDRDPLYPVEMAVDMYRAIPRSALRVVLNGGHGPISFDASPPFVQTALSFFRRQDETPSP